MATILIDDGQWRLAAQTCKVATFGVVQWAKEEEEDALACVMDTLHGNARLGDPCEDLWHNSILQLGGGAGTQPHDGMTACLHSLMNYFQWGVLECMRLYCSACIAPPKLKEPTHSPEEIRGQERLLVARLQCCMLWHCLLIYWHHVVVHICYCRKRYAQRLEQLSVHYLLQISPCKNSILAS